MTAYRPYSAYRNSGIRWLEEIPEHWCIKRLKTVANITFSNVDKHSFEDEETVYLCNYVDVYKNNTITPRLNFMKATASKDEIKKFLLKKNDVLITKDSESWNDIAIPAFVTDDFDNVLCGYHLSIIRPHSRQIDGKFLFYSFKARAINYQLEVEATGVTRYGIDQYAIGNAYLFVPPLPEQRAIVDFLDRETARIDALIAKYQRLIKLVDEKRASTISQAITTGISSSAEMKDSGIPWLGKIPIHWEIVRNKSILTEVDIRSTTGDEELLSVSHITGVTPRSEKDVNMFLAESNIGYKRCSPNDLVINTMWAWMGALGISKFEGIVSPSYNVYRFRQNVEVFPPFFDYLYRTPEYITEINRFSKGVWSSRLRLYPDEFYNMWTLVPPLQEQKEIVFHIQRRLLEVEKIEQKLKEAINKFIEYRNGLISSAITGKIKVPA